MKIADLTEEHMASYFVCLEEWSDEIKEAGDHKACWYHSMKDKGLRVKLALTEEGKAVGLIQYLPVEHSYAEGKELYAILCIWVHGYKQGPGNHQKKGVGKTLLKAAETDAIALGAKGMVAWGLSIPVWMKASWFKKQGYVRADQLGFLGPELVWKPFSKDASPPRWIRQKKKPGKIPGQVTVTCFINGWCPAQNLACERAKRATGELGEKAVFQEIVTRNRDTFLAWGVNDALYIDGKKVRTGPPPSYQKLKKKIARQVGRL
jgi:GNAT superfamily N-acetyltransferase